MSMAEWALRNLPQDWFAHSKSLVDPIAYGTCAPCVGPHCGSPRVQPEWYYMQAHLRGDLLKDLDGQCGAMPLLQSALQDVAAEARRQPRRLESEPVKVTQAPRLWLSPGGAISPLHFDLSLSHLVQVHGAKRMTFYSPDQLSLLRPFPSSHMLSRRCTYDRCGQTDWSTTASQPLRAKVTTLGPGDIVLFAPLWSHHTISASPSASVTFRVQCA